MTKLLAVVALLLLAPMDYLLIAAAFLGEPAAGEALIIGMVIGLLFAIWFRQRWLVYVVQSTVTTLMLLRIFQSMLPSSDFHTSVSPLVGYLVSLIELALGYLLAWLIARAIPTRVVTG